MPTVSDFKKIIRKNPCVFGDSTKKDMVSSSSQNPPHFEFDTHMKLKEKSVAEFNSFKIVIYCTI